MKVLIVFSLCFSLIAGLHLNPDFHRMFKSKLRGRTGGRIVGGTDVDIERHPWQLAMFEAGYFVCGGVILTEQWAMSAAHCFEHLPITYTITFRAGSTHREEGGQEVMCMHYEINPGYDEYYLSFDVAIVHLYERFNWGDNIKPVVLPRSEFEAEHGTEVVVSGWGYDSAGHLPLNLQETTIPVVSRKICEESWPGWLDETMMCAGAVRGRDTCGGDSGGPLTQNGILLGLTSWGSIDCGDGYPGVYTRVSHPEIISWIERQTGHHVN